MVGVILQDKKYMTKGFEILIKAKGMIRRNDDDLQVVFVNFLCLKDYIERNLVHSIERIID